jgi:hypothetical protein
MMGMDETNESQAELLCKACGLCCTGHLFIWAKLKPSELDPAEALGMTVYRSDPNQRGFSQPCPLWKGECTIYHSPNYPRVCRAYKCKQLKEVIAEKTSFASALAVVKQVKEMIEEVEAILPVSPNSNFRERLVAQIENPDQTAGQEDAYQEFRLKADALLLFYETYFGVTGFFE